MKEEFKAYIQYALDETKPLPANLNDGDWQGFFHFCYRHSILGLVYHGLERANRPIPQQVLFEWISSVESIKQQNDVVNKRLLVVCKV